MNDEIQILGFSYEALLFIKSFMNGIPEKNMVPIIGLIKSSRVCEEDGEVIERGEHFVLAAISKWFGGDLDDNEACELYGKWYKAGRPKGPV